MDETQGEAQFGLDIYTPPRPTSPAQIPKKPTKQHDWSPHLRVAVPELGYFRNTKPFQLSMQAKTGPDPHSVRKASIQQG